MFKNRCNDRECPSRDECTLFDSVKIKAQWYFFEPRNTGEDHCNHFKPQVAEEFA